MSENKNNLTTGESFSIMVSEDEKRIIINLRKQAKAHSHATISIVIHTHNAEIKNGEVVDVKDRL